MMIKASLHGARIAEVPITLHPDGRVSHPPHLRTLRDGWRTLRFFLLYCPRWLFEFPGSVLILLGLLGYGLALPGTRIGSVNLDAHTLLFASVAILCGFQAILFSVFATAYAVNARLIPANPRIERRLAWFSLERGIIAGTLVLLAGVALLLWAVNLWRLAGFGNLDYARTMRWVIPGATLTALGFQTVLASFFISLLSLPRR
jgi:hypothetical protein